METGPANWSVVWSGRGSGPSRANKHGIRGDGYLGTYMTFCKSSTHCMYGPGFASVGPWNNTATPDKKVLCETKVGPAHVRWPPLDRFQRCGTEGGTEPRTRIPVKREVSSPDSGDPKGWGG